MLSRNTRTVLAAALFALSSLVPALAERVVTVSSAVELRDAIDLAVAGDVIELAPGTYALTANLLCDTAGTESAPIVVRARHLGSVFLRFDATEGFKVSQPHWTFENLDIEGVCATDSACEHAFHLFGNADNTLIRNNRLHEYNAMIKSNGFLVDDVRRFPDDVVVEFNDFWNDAVRATSNPVTFVDVVGGRRWIVRANRLRDFAKGEGNGISYAAFLKGNSRDGLFERNLVICEDQHTEGIRLGLSFGGGGTAPDSVCEGGTCTPEHQNGVMRNNLIINCPDDVGIYLNEALNTQVHHNTLYLDTGIDVRFQASTADLRNNIMSGTIRNRDGGTHTASSNVTDVETSEWEAWFVNPASGDFSWLDGAPWIDQGETGLGVDDDFCGQARSDGNPDLGAVEAGTPCATTAGGGGYALLFLDDFESGNTDHWTAANG